MTKSTRKLIEELKDSIAKFDSAARQRALRIERYYNVGKVVRQLTEKEDGRTAIAELEQKAEITRSAGWLHRARSFVNKYPPREFKALMSQAEATDFLTLPHVLLTLGLEPAKREAMHKRIIARGLSVSELRSLLRSKHRSLRPGSGRRISPPKDRPAALLRLAAENARWLSRGRVLEEAVGTGVRKTSNGLKKAIRNSQEEQLATQLDQIVKLAQKIKMRLSTRST